MKGEGIRSVARKVALAIVASGAAACGGGGGDGTAAVELALTSANRDTVAHAAATSFLAFDVVGAVPLRSDGVATGRERAAQVARAGSGLDDAWLSRVLGAVGSHWGAPPREQAQAIIGPEVEPCSDGGTLSLTIDDHDNDGMLSAGDVFTFAFSNCREGPDLMNGSLSVAFVSLGATTLPSFRARLTFRQLSDEADDQRHRISLDGAANFDYAQHSASAESFTVTAVGPVVAAVYTHAFGDDTVTMDDGYVQQSVLDVAAPARTTTTLSGRIHSQRAGGRVSVTTPIGPILHYGADAYPSSGTLRITGRTGRIDLTALSAVEVRVDLDENDDGMVDSTFTGAWDWLL